LHAVPINESHLAVIEEWNDFWYLSQEGRIKKSKEFVQEHINSFTQAGFGKEELFDALDKAQIVDFDGVKNNSYCHGDLDARHLLVDEDMHLTGIIDWEMCILDHLVLISVLRI